MRMLSRSLSVVTVVLILCAGLFCGLSVVLGLPLVWHSTHAIQNLQPLSSLRNSSEQNNVDVCTNVTDVSFQECKALEALFNATNGNNWIDKNNWLQLPSACKWAGVACSANKISDLKLADNRLSGTIPSEIGNLTALRTLHLHDNQLTGIIPPEISNLTQLEELSLYRNQLSGEIPGGIFNLTRLTHLLLAENQFSGTLPETIGNLVALKELRLYSNNLSGPIPTSIGNLINLQELKLGTNPLTGAIPPEISNLTKLSRLGLNSDQLTGEIPPGIWNLTELTDLDLSKNSLTGVISSGIGNLTKLTKLNLDNNPISGIIPEAIGNLINLREIQLSNDQLTGSIPAEIGNLKKLEQLVLYRNHLTGTIPSEIGSLTNLVTLGLGDNQLSGVIPQEIGQLRGVDTIDMGNNHLSGTIPSGITNLVQLTKLSLNKNNLTGEIPPEIGSLSHLNTLDLGANQLDGVIPDSVGDLVELRELYLGQNKLIGELPVSIVNLHNLTNLAIGDNQLSGQIPQGLGELQQLQTLYLTKNRFNGMLPQTLGNLINLEELHVDDNPVLSGDLPDELSRLVKLKRFRFNDTKLCESRTPEFQNWLSDLAMKGSLKSTGVECPIRLSLVKSVTPEEVTISEVKQGITAIVSLTVTANTTTTIALTDIIPSGMTLVEGSNSTGTIYNSESKQLIYIGSLHPGEALNIIYNAVIDKDSQAGAVFNILTEISGDGTESVDKAATIVIPNPATADILHLIYVGADNELSDDGLKLLNNAEEGANSQTTSNIVTILLLDGPGKEDTRIYKVLADPVHNKNCPDYYNPTCNGRYTLGKNLFEVASDNTASEASLSDFIAHWIRANPNAKQIVLSIVGHGSGWSADGFDAQPGGWFGQSQRGFLWDQSEKKTISTAGLRRALENARKETNRKFSLIYLDACSMAMAEVAYEIANEADYMLASENIKWTSFPYDKLLSVNGDNGEEIGREWLKIETEVLQKNPGHPFTLSLIDLSPSKMELLKEHQKIFSEVLRDQLNSPTTHQRLADALNNTQCFDSNYDYQIGNDDTYCDLSSFLYQVGMQFSDTNEVLEATKNLSDSVQTVVLGETHKSGTPWNHPQFSWSFDKNPIGGLSIYLPLQQSHNDQWQELYVGQYLKWVNDTGWDTLLNKFWNGETLQRDFACDSQDCRLSGQSLPVQFTPETDSGFRVYLPVVTR